MNYLGYMWAERGVNLPKARELIEKAVKLEPKNAAYLDSLAWVIYKLDQPRKRCRGCSSGRAFGRAGCDALRSPCDIYSAMQQPAKAQEA